ncbi:MAG: hypothetical protein AVDCRST_MAG78-3598, partial [uncultured Rubrobacteraceae bacterium]
CCGLCFASWKLAVLRKSTLLRKGMVLRMAVPQGRLSRG